MSADGPSKSYPRDNNGLFNMYSALLQPTAQFDFRQHAHGLFLPSVPLSMQLYQQNPQFQQQETQQRVSGQLGQSSPQDQQLVSTQPIHMSPPTQQVSTPQSNQMSPPTQQEITLQSNQISNKPQPLTTQSNQISAHSQQSMISQGNQISPQALQLISSQPNKTLPDPKPQMFCHPNQTSLQLFGGHINFPQNIPQIQQNARNFTVDLNSGNFIYDQLGLDDLGSAQLRPDLLATSESLIEEREQDLNINRIARNPFRYQGQSVFPTSGNVPKTFDALMPELESPNLTSETLLTTVSNCFTRNITPPILNPARKNNVLLNPPTSCNDMLSASQGFNLPVSSNGVNLSGTSVNSTTHLGQFLVKQEPKGVNAADTRNLGLSTAPVWQNPLGNHLFRDAIRTATGNEFLEFTSSAANTFLANVNMGDTLLIPPQQRAPKRCFEDSLVEFPARRASECSTSSSVTSLDESTATSSNNETNNNGTRATPTGGSRDPSYQEKRRKNNESARKSRDARRTKEREVAEAVVRIEKQNALYFAHLQVLIKENHDLHRNLQMYEYK